MGVGKVTVFLPPLPPLPPPPAFFSFPPFPFFPFFPFPPLLSSSSPSSSSPSSFPPPLDVEVESAMHTPDFKLYRKDLSRSLVAIISFLPNSISNAVSAPASILAALCFTTAPSTTEYDTNATSSPPAPTSFTLTLSSNAIVAGREGRRGRPVLVRNFFTAAFTFFLSADERGADDRTSSSCLNIVATPSPSPFFTQPHAHTRFAPLLYSTPAFLSFWLLPFLFHL
mmetsp:Transcript_15423/g.39008  ORF Transcript_15423/g.39008 Transcript_15423/m.39008 type:complete len:226 (-) Transcript_15423:82-759(-)